MRHDAVHVPKVSAPAQSATPGASISETTEPAANLAEAPATTETWPFVTADQILGRVRPALSEEGAQYVRKAWEFARQAHEGQRRRSGEPYFSHCAEVGYLIAGLVSDWPTICAGLLHDTIEDCGITREQIAENFTEPVAGLVEGVTKISTIHFSSPSEQQATNLRKMILAMARDVRVVLIKLCDRLHNMRTLEYLRPDRQQFIAATTLEIYVPLAKRLGIEKISKELEDLCIKYLHPQVFKTLAAHLERNRDRYTGRIRQMKKELEDIIAETGITARVSGRLKHIASIFNKMQGQGLDVREVHDLIAMRVICETVGQCYEVLGLVHSRWQPMEGRFKDYIASPKPNGYQSIHTTLIIEGELVEVQIRTKAMHKVAEQGVAAHWGYKEVGPESRLKPVEAERVAWIRQLVDWLSDIRDPDEFMAAVKQDVYEASIFCYTPRGDVVELHKDATALDFAYRIHTEVGNRCAGARVNHKMASLRTVLKTGDIVEIITSKTAHPTRDWVRIATSNRARNKIRHWLKTNDRDFYVERGRALIIADLTAKSIDLTDSALIAQLEQLASQFSLSGAEDVFVEVGFGTLKPGAVTSKLVRVDAPPVAPAPMPRKKLKAYRAQPKSDAIMVEGIPGALTRIARCCAPQPPDPIVGFVTQGRGISVHHRDCSAFAHILASRENAVGRIVQVDWAEDSHPRLKVTIRITCQDRQGLLNDVTRAVSSFDVSIIQSSSSSNLRTNKAIVKMTLLVSHEEDLNSLLRRVEETPSVLSVSRVIHQK